MNDLHELLLEFPKDQVSKYCSICHEKWPQLCPIKDCKHSFCAKCINLYLDYKITSGEVLSVTCPFTDCNTELEASFVKLYVSPSMYCKYKSFKKLRLLEKNINLRWCPEKGCEGYSIGGLKNKKLTCNVCSRLFCFFCGNKWHENEKCSNKIEKEFEKWAQNNNVKFCPNCKHRVYRSGGCTEMRCVCCQYTWCWNCGVSSKDHRDYQCLLGKNVFELYWVTIFSFVLSPILFPFAFFLAVVLKYEVFQQNYNHVKVWVRILFYLGLFIVSPLLLVLAVLGYCMVFVTQVLMEYIPRKIRAFSILLGIFIGFTVGVLVFSVSAAVCMVLPAFGIGFLGIKVAFVLKRRCRYEKKWEYYPRTVV